MTVYLVKKLVCLIDPSWDYHKLLDVINKNWKSLKTTTEVWAGCSHDKGKKTRNVLNELDIPLENKFLFPGTVRQGIYAGDRASVVYIPLVVGKRFSLKRVFIKMLVFIGNVSVMLLHRKTKRLNYLYLVLSKKTRVGKKVDADEISDSDAIELIGKNLKNRLHHIYVEGGSNAKHSVAERANLLKQIKNMFNIPLYCGGGIRTCDEFKRAIKIADKVIVGHNLGKNPEDILKFSRIVKKLNKS